MTESERNAAFKSCPILKDYLATALQDLQFYEADSACMEEREERDAGTIYDCPDSTFQRAWNDCAAFMEAMGDQVEAYLDLVPGEAGLRYARGIWPAIERVGSTFYLLRVGHGVSFTDDGDADCLKAMDDYTRGCRIEGLYFSDDGKAYLM